jgi:uncharacterized protein involved in exopolysaccharide biosynthesis
MNKGLVISVVLGLLVAGTVGCNVTYTSAAYLSVDPPKTQDDKNVAAALNTLKKSYVQLATDGAVLTRAVNEDTDQNGVKLNRIRNTSWFTGDPAGTIALLEKKLSAESVKDTNLIRLSLSGANPKDLPEVIDAIAEAMVYISAENTRQERMARQNTLAAKLDKIDEQISVKRKAIDRFRGQSELPLMREQRKITQINLQALTTELTQLRLLKAQAQASLKALKVQNKNGKLAKEIQQMESQVTAVNERLLAVENQYDEKAQEFRSLGVSLTSIKTLQAEIERLQGNATQIDRILFQLRSTPVASPLSIRSQAEIPTKPSR